MILLEKMEKTPKRCEYCGHSRAAHIDGMRCALCGCVPGRQTFVQESFGFPRESVTRVKVNTRKR